MTAKLGFSCAALVIAALAPVGVAGADASDWTFDPPFGPHRGRIGVQVQSMTPELREHMKAPADRGILVTRVVPDRPGAAADLRVGDVIVEADNDPMEGPSDLVRAVAGVAKGDEIELKIVRDGKEHKLKVAPEGKPRAWMDPDRWGEWMERGLQHGGHELRRRLHELEQRLEQLERRLAPEPAGDEAQT